MEAKLVRAFEQSRSRLRKAFCGGEVRIEPPDQIEGGLFPKGSGRPFLLRLSQGIHTQRGEREILNDSDSPVCWIKIPWK
jgi:hypothetical protein